MNTNQGGSGQGQIISGKNRLTVVSKDEPDSGYFNGDNKQSVVDDYFGNRGIVVDGQVEERGSSAVDSGLVDGSVVHRGPNVSEEGEFRDETRRSDVSDSLVMDENLRNGLIGGEIGDNDKEIVDGEATKGWQSTLTEEEIREGFEDYFNSEGGNGGRYDDEYNYESGLSGNGVESEGYRDDKYDVRLDKNNNVGYDTVLDTMAIGGDMDSGDNENGERLSGGSDERPVAKESIKTMDTLLRKNGEESLPESGEVNSPEDSLQNSQEIAKLEAKKKALLGRVEKAKLILDKLLADKEELVKKTQFLGVGEESASSLAEEIEVKKAEVDNLQKQISEVDQQLEVISHTEKQAGVTEDEKSTEKKEVIKGGGEMTEKSEEGIRLNGNLEEGLSNSTIENDLVDEVIDDSMDDSVEVLPDGSLVGVIKEGRTVLDVIEELILRLNGDGDRGEAESMGMIAFGNFRLKFLNMSVDKGMTKEEALSSWKNLLTTLRPGDKIVIGLSDQGVELDIPVISNHIISTNKIIEDGVADDYNLAQVA